VHDVFLQGRQQVCGKQAHVSAAADNSSRRYVSRCRCCACPHQQACAECTEIPYTRPKHLHLQA
jgi:hypothetical protein